jgi:hypothetical protein
VKLVQEFGNAVRTFVHHDGARHFEKGGEAFLSPFFVREKSLKVESVARKTGRHQSRDKRRSTGQAFHGDTGIDAGSHE